MAMYDYPFFGDNFMVLRSAPPLLLDSFLFTLRKSILFMAMANASHIINYKLNRSG